MISMRSSTDEGKDHSSKVVVGSVMISARSSTDVIHVGSLVAIMIISNSGFILATFQLHSGFILTAF